MPALEYSEGSGTALAVLRTGIRIESFPRRPDNENALQRAPIDRLLQCRNVTESSIYTLNSVSRYERERNIARLEKLGDRINLFLTDIHIENGGVDFIQIQCRYRLSDLGEWADDMEAHFGEGLRHHHCNQRLVFDDKHVVPLDDIGDEALALFRGSFICLS